MTTPVFGSGHSAFESFDSLVARFFGGAAPQSRSAWHVDMGKFRRRDHRFCWTTGG